MKVDWWTLGFQTVNVLVLVALLRHFFWRPVAAMIALRATTARQTAEAATAAQVAATAATAEIATTRAGFAAERDAILAAARKMAQQESAARVSAATTDAAAIATRAQAQAAKDAAAAGLAWTDRAGQLAVQIAARLLGGLESSALRAAFFDRLLQHLHALNPADRQALATDGTALHAVSAQPLDTAEQTGCAAALAEALGTHPAITFAVDPSLLAGFELRAPHAIVSNSLRADLDRIKLELTHDA